MSDNPSSKTKTWDGTIEGASQDERIGDSPEARQALGEIIREIFSTASRDWNPELVDRVALAHVVKRLVERGGMQYAQAVLRRLADAAPKAGRRTDG